LASSTLPQDNHWRFERKYRLTYQQYLRVKNALIPYVQFDPFTVSAPDHRYLVRSLYFDTPDYQVYNEKLEGNNSRHKFRIRTYSPAIQPDTVIRVEAKLKRGDRSEKLGAFVPLEVYCDFMRDFHWSEDADPVLIEFERSLHARILRPKVLVEYNREGYQCRDHDGIRITFDHHVRSAHTRELFPPCAFFRQHDPHVVILEIKHRNQQPDWLRNIIQSHSLMIEPNSKYCQGIDVTQCDLVNHALRV